jgi:hypothetical protein
MAGMVSNTVGISTTFPKRLHQRQMIDYTIAGDEGIVRTRCSDGILIPCDLVLGDFSWDLSWDLSGDLSGDPSNIPLVAPDLSVVTSFRGGAFSVR